MPDGNDRYREAARRLYGKDGVKVPSHGFVQPTEDGAFVEAVVWVSKIEIEQTFEGGHDAAKAARAN
jgi:hypothetical protein